MLSFSSQPHFLCPPCEGGHGNLFVQKGPLFVVGLLSFGVFFFKHCRSLEGLEIKRGMILAFQNALLAEISVLDTALLFICAGDVVWWPRWVSNLRRGSVPCASFVPSFFFFWRPGRNFLILSRLNGHLVFPGSGGTSPPWFLRDR